MPYQLTADYFEQMTVKGDRLTANQIVWRRYRKEAKGVTELMLRHNPHLARGHRTSPFIPVGTVVKIPIVLDILSDKPRGQAQPTVTLYGKTTA